MQLKVLKDESLTKPDGIDKVEGALEGLYNAMLKIDPKLRHNDARPSTADQASLHRSGSTGHGGSDLSSMHAVREKRESYRREITDFIQRFKQYMTVKFRDLELQTLDALERNRNNKAVAASTKLDEQLRVRPKQGLWQYSPLMLFAREMEPSEWEDLMRMYEASAKRPYQDEFRDNVFAWKRITRKPIGDEQDVLFTNQEKEPESIVGRKLTVKRTKTVRTDGSSRISSGDKPNDGKVTAYEAFAGSLIEMSRTMSVEQNFIVDLFHASSLDAQDFSAAIVSRPQERQAGDLLAKKSFDPDREMAKKVLSVMEDIYSFWPIDLQNLVDWAVKQDALNAVGVLFALESRSLEFEETNQEFLVQTLAKVHERLTTHFTRFMDEQIRGIEDTKVKVKKRKGVIAFMRTFPNFSLSIENMLQPTNDELPVRIMVNDAYQRTVQTMFESLKFIAKESPNAAASTAAGDPEDKEALNYHILLIENMNHYIEEVATRNNSILDEWNFRARAEMGEHMELYLTAVIRRPLGKLLDFLESTETLVRNSPSSSKSIATRASHSRSTFKKILSSYDSKEIRRGIETLKKRVEKHFGDGDDTPGLSRELIVKVCRECEARYLNVAERVDKVVRDVYDGSLEVEWRREDVVGAFRR
ncbi:exocyst complex component 1, partial [Lecanoromycetidae sp. Uapishka_2]